MLGQESHRSPNPELLRYQGLCKVKHWNADVSPAYVWESLSPFHKGGFSYPGRDPETMPQPFPRLCTSPDSGAGGILENLRLPVSVSRIRNPYPTVEGEISLD